MTKEQFSVSLYMVFSAISLLHTDLAMGEPSEGHEKCAASCGNSYQLVPYQPTGILPMFAQKTRNFEFAGKNWVVRQQWDEIGVASVVWEPAILLARHLVDLGDSVVSGARVIELGAGTGLVGMVASALDASSVVLTDKDTRPAEINLKENEHNLHGNDITTSTLEWGASVATFNPPYDIVLAADVIYIEETFPSLIRTLEDLSDVESVVLLSCKYRYQRDERFFEMLADSGKFEDEVVRTWPGKGEVKVHRLRRTRY